MSVDPLEGAENAAGAEGLREVHGNVDADVDADVDGNVDMSIDMAKQAAGRRAAGLVEAGMRVGLGTGTTVRWTIVALGERRLADLVCVATSSGTERLAQSVGLHLVPPDDAGRLDLAVDGADEVDAHWNLVKGGGGALAREKVVAEMADRFVVVVDGSKVVTRLGAFGLPVEALAFAPGVVAARLRSLGAARVERRPEPSDNGNPLLRAYFGAIADPAELAAQLGGVPGVVEHGLFLGPTVSEVIVAHADGRVDAQSRA